ncbi:MAG: hypothetical protein S4CHLAM27_02730 [Chlamydiia bacterium]|nr:hypothetical protein [Chlamydiia bacterium]
MAGALFAIAATMSTALFGAEEMETVKTRKPNGCMGPVLCTQNPMVINNACPCNANWQFEVGLIYEQAKFANMTPGNSYAPAYYTAGTFVATTVAKLEQTFDYNIGLLLSLGRYLPHDDWYVETHFDWLSSTKSANYSSAGTVYSPNADFDRSVLLGLTLPINQAFESIAYNASMQFYTLDFTLSRGSYVSKNFAFEPTIGVEVLWLSSTQKATYPIAGDITNSARFNDRQNNWGAGPRFGLNGLYHLAQELYFFCDNSVAVLAGEARYNNTSTLTAGSVVTGEQAIPYSSAQSTQYYIPVRSIIGVKLAKYCLEEKHYLALKIGYDARAVISATDASKGFVSGGLYVNAEWSF